MISLSSFLFRGSIRHIVVLVLSFVAFLSKGAPWDSDSIHAIFDGRTLDPIEGVWQLPDDGAKLLIHRTSLSTYEIVMLDSPRLDLAPGIVIGKAIVTPGADIYNAKFSNRPIHSFSVKKSNATLSVSKDDCLVIKPYSGGKKISVSLRSFFTSILRIRVIDERTPQEVQGAYRLYPPTQKPCL